MSDDHCSQLESETGWRLDLLCQLIESVREYAIFGTDMSGRIRSWNIGAEEIFGYKADEAIGQNIDILFTDADRAENIPGKEREIARLDGYAEDQRWHVKKDGSLFFASGVQTPLRDEHGNRPLRTVTASTRSPLVSAVVTTCRRNIRTRCAATYGASISSNTASATRGSWHSRETPPLPGLSCGLARA